jgi:murein DD-endopeptidase MepM/ murein hydrolase activator NlpD
VFLINLEVPPSLGGTDNVAAENLKTDATETSKTAALSLSNPASPAVPAAPPSVAPPAIGAASAAPLIDADIAYLTKQRLLIPVAEKTPADLRDSFYDARSGGRTHNAMDIMAPQGTPVLATADGRLKPYNSELGGIMLYQIDASGPYVYCYAHLDRYADGVYEGKVVKRGEVIAYVGDTGNARPGNYHLHFGISRMSAPGKWSGGQPINPYSVFTAR